MRVLGLDASTSTIGLSVIDYKDGYISLHHVEYFKPSKKGTIFERLSGVRKFITSKLIEFNPDDVVLEDIILFMKNHSTAKTVSALSILNRTVGLAVFDAGYQPVLLNVMSIRHKIKNGKKLPHKSEIPELVAGILNIKFPYLYNKKKELLIENEDMADAIAVGLAFIKGAKPVEKKVKKRSKKTRYK